MNLQNIVVCVREMKLEAENKHNQFLAETSRFVKEDVTKVILSQEDGGPFKNLTIIATIPAGVLNPFTLGQRLVIMMR